MKIIYITQTRFPTEKAHGHQIAMVCKAMAELGHGITLLQPVNKNKISEDAFSYYSIPADFKIEKLPIYDAVSKSLIPNILAFPLSMHSYRRQIKKYLHKNRADLLYCRSVLVLDPLIKSGIPVILELHSLPRHLNLGLINKCRKIVCLTSPMKNRLIGYGVRQDIIIVEGDAVDLSMFEKNHDKNMIKKNLKLPSDKPIIGYVGRLKTLNMEKGVKTLIESLFILKGKTSLFGLIVGGPESDRYFYENMARKVGLTENDLLFTGPVPFKEVPAVLAVSNILVMPFPDLPHYRYNMSPLKMFEYLAAGKPVLTTDLPSVRDVLNESNALFCRPGDPEDLAEKILLLLKYPNMADKMSAQSLKTAQNHSWKKRMARIINSFSGLKEFDSICSGCQPENE